MSDLFTYTVPNNGFWQSLIVLLAHGGGTVPTATLNGQSVTMVYNVGNGDCNNIYASNEYVGYLNNPTSGTFSLNKGGAYVADFVVFTVNDADISGNPIGAYYCTAHSPGSVNIAVSTTTPSANDLIVDWGVNGGIDLSSHGAGQTEFVKSNDSAVSYSVTGSYVQGSSTTNTLQGMSETWASGSGNFELQMVAIKSAASGPGTTTTSTYTYAGTGYANPHAVNQIANGQSTTTYSYDQNGNLSQKTTDGVTTTYLWDYANRLVALGSGGATTTYGYDAFGSRVFQTTATSTTIYPLKWYSVASSTGSGATYATTTEYVFNGDALVSTIDQQLASGVATGTAQTRYIHPDHLGSTNVVTNASGTVVQTLDYYPYGATRISTNLGGADSARKYIGQFSDISGLSYLNARYMDPSRGQNLTQDPAVLGGDPSLLSDPQQLNLYSYARGNPLILRDRGGKKVELVTRPVYSDAIGAHAFILITNNSAAAANLQGLPSTMQNPTRITLGGYTDNFVAGDLYKGINNSRDYDLSTSEYIERTEIVAPQQFEGNQTAFENAVILI